MTDLRTRLIELREKATKGTWSWEDDGDGVATVYAGRVDQMGEWNGIPMYAHGLNLFGRLEPDRNGKNNLDLVCELVNNLDTIIAALQPSGEMVMVPREPTEEMQNAARDWSYKKYGKPIGGEASRECYRAMIAAAPSPPTRGRATMLDELRLAEDLAKLERIEAEAREDFKDPQITFVDVAAIRRCAALFGVTSQMAYLRAKSLGLLPYQRKESSHD
ncbi:hypothetical protein [Microvirga sp. G4-2]|uniref:hypothetical protein n=1 Tax=Microvirga sp. G4-2 TaxID=3434467 RepID=UPI0040449DA7